MPELSGDTMRLLGFEDVDTAIGVFFLLARGAMGGLGETRRREASSTCRLGRGYCGTPSNSPGTSHSLVVVNDHTSDSAVRNGSQKGSPLAMIFQ